MNERIEDLNKLGLYVNAGFDGFSVLWIGGFNKGNRDMLDFKAHNHTFFEVHFIADGSICYHFDGESVCLVGDDLLIIPPGCVHSLSQRSADFRKITISFEVDRDTDFYEALVKKSKKCLPIPTDVSDCIDFIIRHVHTKTEYNDVVIKNRLYEIIVLIAECYSSKIRSRSLTDSDIRLERAKKYIDDNPDSFFTCDEVAYYCNISAKQLGRIFKENEGCSLLEYIHKRKIDLAKQMIRESDEKLDSISSALGFSSVNYFGKFFSKFTGMTPGEYRRISEKPHNIK